MAVLKGEVGLQLLRLVQDTVSPGSSQFFPAEIKNSFIFRTVVFRSTKFFFISAQKSFLTLFIFISYFL